MHYQSIFDILWQQYTRQNPQALAIYQHFIDAGETVVNDHVAFRTFDDPRVDIDVLARVFLECGYKKVGDYDFPVKKLKAHHFEHPDKHAPKVFISQLLTKSFSKTCQQIATACVDAIPPALLESDELIYSGVSWRPLSYETYQALLTESEYAAWLYAFGFCANHFTVSVNHLKHFEDMAEVNTFIKSHGYTLNAAGGEIKGTPADLLVQSSTKAECAEVEFIQGKKSILSCYYEFAKRYTDKRGELYSGFVASSADKLFESTDVKPDK